ncbi:hypothetical protein QCA50_005157 [Cerrena zonata]|uniref:Uncharacterized protein n=1 Tax=Cerrena zonata TaxID=2478898 RepID=A0AAW0GQE8_9APHY
MAYGLEMGNERTTAITKRIQEELMKRGWAFEEADTVMAEYCVIMIINNKTHAQVLAELNDLVGTLFEPDFVDWLFEIVEGAAPENAAPPPPEPKQAPTTPSREAPPHVQNDNSRRPPQAPRAPLYQQAISQALPSSSPNDRKRTRSQSPAQSSKIRRTDLPTGPRAMYRDSHDQPSGSSRSLLDRVGPRNGPPHGNFPNNQSRNDHIQQRIDNITNGPQPDLPMMMNPPFPMNGIPPMDMNAMAGMTNPLMLQEVMMNQMALMSQMAGALGMMNQGVPMMNGGFPVQPGMGGDAAGFNANGQHMDGAGRGRGRGRGGPPGRGRGGRGGPPQGDRNVSNQGDSNGSTSGPTNAAESSAASASAPKATLHAPTPVAAPTPSSATTGRSGFVPPERPQSPTLCKFGLKCTNPLCRWSHPSPVATPESGVVLSNDPCDKGKDCKDKDCIKAHVSPAVLNPGAEHLKPNHYTPPVTHHSGPHQVACRFGNACTRANCTFQHPHRQEQPHRQSTQPCRFGVACTRATCTFQHPEGRVLPNSFHRGLAPTGGMSTVAKPEAGSANQSSPHKSVTFNRTASGAGNASAASELQKKMKEMEEMKNKVAQAEAAAASKKQEDNKSVSISA